MKGIIYSIVEISTNERVYVGSTKTKLYNRKNVHLYYCFNKEKEIPVYEYIRNVTNNDRKDFDNKFYFEELYTGDFSDVKELRKAEREFQEKYKPKLNIMKAWVDNSKGYNIEWYKENREKVREKNRQYQKTHKQTISQCKKKYYKENREKVLQQKKDYYAANREKVLQQKKDYYAASKENREKTIQ